jgi:hypothetical protein
MRLVIVSYWKPKIGVGVLPTTDIVINFLDLLFLPDVTTILAGIVPGIFPYAVRVTFVLFDLTVVIGHTFTIDPI